MRGFSPTWRRTYLIPLLSALALMMGSCGTSSGATNALPDSQQILRLPIVASSADIGTMDPAKVSDFQSYLPIELVFPGLMALNNNLQPVPWAAQGMPTLDVS